MNAIGLIETKGLIALVEATDAMAKAANVEIIKRVSIGGAYVTTCVVRRCRAACGRLLKPRARQPLQLASSFRATLFLARPTVWSRLICRKGSAPG